MATLIGARGIQNRSNAERAALVKAAQYIGIDPDWLAVVEGFESGNNPEAINPKSGASGVIQWLPSTAARLFNLENTPANRDTAIQRVRSMSYIEQQELVKKYFEPVRGKLKSLEDTYLVVFYPAAIGKASDAVISTAGQKTYDQNKGFDHSAKGYITKADITGTIRSLYNKAVNEPRVAVSVGVGAFVAAVATGFGLHRLITNKGQFT